MTSTNFNVGLDTTSRLTSRVLKPPGGGHTDIFGAGQPEPTRVKNYQASSIVLGNEDETPKPTNGTAITPTEETPKETENGDKHAVSEVAEKAESKPEIVAEPPKVEPPRRVRVPPGGFSSGLW